MIGRGLRRLRTAAFWLAGPDYLCVAVCRRTREEPVLCACAAVGGRLAKAADRPSVGLLEAAAEVDALGLPHVVALAAEFCPVERREPDESGVVIPGLDERAYPAAAVVERVEGLFAACRLHLVGIDCETCALLTLAEFLGIPAAEAARTDPLAAVSVASSCETSAAGLGSKLCVPVGLALARLAHCGRRA